MSPHERALFMARAEVEAWIREKEKEEAEVGRTLAEMKAKYAGK